MSIDSIEPSEESDEPVVFVESSAFTISCDNFFFNLDCILSNLINLKEK